jgi:hypothetical protein
VSESTSHGGRSRSTTRDDDVGAFAVSFVVLRHDDDDQVSDKSSLSDTAGSDGLAVEEGELLRPAKTSSSARGHHDGRDRHA